MGEAGRKNGFLEDVEGLVLDVLDVVLVREADDGGELVEGARLGAVIPTVSTGSMRYAHSQGSPNPRGKRKDDETYRRSDLGSRTRRRCVRSSEESVS